MDRYVETAKHIVEIKCFAVFLSSASEIENVPETQVHSLNELSQGRLSKVLLEYNIIYFPICFYNIFLTNPVLCINAPVVTRVSKYTTYVAITQSYQLINE